MKRVDVLNRWVCVFVADSTHCECARRRERGDVATHQCSEWTRGSRHVCEMVEVRKVSIVEGKVRFR